MTLTSHTAPYKPPGYTFRRWRRVIMSFVSVIGTLIFVLLLANIAVVLMIYENNNNSNNNSASNVSLEINSQAVSTVKIMPLPNEFATMIINADSDHQMIKNNGNGKSDTHTHTHNDEHNAEDYSQTQLQQVYEIKNNSENPHNNITTIRSNKTGWLPAPSTPQHNRLVDDRINISNQRNEINGRPSVAEATTVASSTVNNSVSTTHGSIPAALDVVYKFSQQQQQQQTEAKITHKSQANTELLLHRQKRYLIFPEGSSFQLVFDLIIGIVDYTSYAILGITCAVAWELPSKPPSELIENLNEKVTEGIYETSETKSTTAATMAMRRNDSITAATAGGADGDSKYGVEGAGHAYVDNANVAAQGLPPINAFEAAYYSKPNPFVASHTGFNGYGKNAEELNAHDSTAHVAYGAYRPANYYTNIPHSNFNNNNNNNNNMYNNLYDIVTRKYGFTDKSEKSSYNDVSNSYGNNNNNNNNDHNNKKPFGNSAHSGDRRDKLPVKFANRWQQQQQQQSQYKKWQSWQDYDSNSWHSYQQPQQKHASKWAHQPQKQQKWSAQSKNAGKDNWWSSDNNNNNNNKQYVTHNWRTKQVDWRENKVHSPEPPPQSLPPVYAPLSGATDAAINSKSDTYEGRSFDESQRRILTARPKARIYPVFGRRRRRRRSSDTKLHDFEHKLERIHLREQLRTRQKLYGKIEKLYETRGLNGSACVLRALCETGQQYKGDRTEPQSFITELLRAIFVLPTSSINHVSDAVNFEEPTLHPTDLHIVDRPYREAQAHRGSCSQLFAMCEHSIWE